MKRTLILVAALVGLSTAANATVSVVIAPDSASYTVGSVITLTVTATADAGEASTQVFGDIIMDQPYFTLVAKEDAETAARGSAS